MLLYGKVLLVLLIFCFALFILGGCSTGKSQEENPSGKNVTSSENVTSSASDSISKKPDTDTPISVLPEGSNGIASKYKEDAGIDSNPDVILADNFDGYTDINGLLQKWSDLCHKENISITNDPSNVFNGEKAVQFEIPQQNEELSLAVIKQLSTESDVLFLRYYEKFDTAFNVAGSSHNGSMISAHYYVNGQATPGIPSDGVNKFLVTYENWREDSNTPNPGSLNIYIYHPEQRSEWGDHFFPTGIVLPFTNTPFDFGPNFVKRPDIVPELGRWYCYEYMVKANTMGKRDGRIACWLDGKLVADFQNLRLRDVDTLKIDRFSIDFHVKNNTEGVAKKWIDNVVAATSYIGPLEK